jgi:hypothetical protein
MLYQLLDLLRYQERQNYLSDNNRIGSSVWFGSQDTEQKRLKHLTNKGKENIMKNIGHSKRK